MLITKNCDKGNCDKWDNIKQSRKTKIRGTKRHQYTTGGGPSCQPIINGCPADQFLNEITDIELIDTPDSDYIPLHCSVPTTIENKIVSDQPVYFITTTSTSNNISPTSPKECPTGKKDSDKMKKMVIILLLSNYPTILKLYFLKYYVF